MVSIDLIVNERKHQVLVDAHETLSSVIRYKLGLTGTKLGCEQGSCGACTVHVNGIAVQACITPVIKCVGKRIVTIENIANKSEVHPLQQKFASSGAIQCGYCTSGMIMTVLDFLQENPKPSRDEIKEAIAGNLCRCTGYKKIIDAIEDYAHNKPTESLDKYKMVGSGRPYLEATKKAKGAADFTDDIYEKNALYCKFLRSPFPHAKITSIAFAEALDIEGVVDIIFGKELPNTFGVLPISEDETAMAIDKTRYIGEIVATVVAETEQIATQALEKIDIKYEPIKSYLEMMEATEDVGENEQIHAHSRFNNNIHKKAELRFGDQNKGYEESTYSAERSFDFEGINHGFTEPHAAIAKWDENGLTIKTATQVPHYLHRSLAKVLEIPMNRVRVIKPYLGGGFGGKSDPFPHEIIISHLARKLGRTIRVRLNREEVFLTNHGRHPTKLSVKMGLDKDKKISVLDADILIDGGAYGSFGVVTTYYNGVLLQAPYDITNFGFRTRRVYTNKPQCGAMRGHGAVNSRFAVETILDELAQKAKIDPCELRLNNLITENSITVGQYRITSNGSKQCIEAVMKQSDWNKRYGQMKKGKGLGVACGFFISGSALPIHWNKYPQSVVHLKVDMDGRVLVTSGASDIGQGSDTMLAIIVAEVLGLSMDNIFVVAADTLLTPIDLGSYSSRVTFMAGNAAKMAAEDLKEKILHAVSEAHDVDKKEINFSEERVFSNNKQIDLSWKEAIVFVTNKVGAVQASGYYNSPKLGGDFKGAGAGLSPSYSFGSVIAEVKVDMDTGHITLENIWGAHDAGKAINPLAVEGQLEGSWHMGLGQAISEQMKYYNGMLLNANFLDYKIPTSLDTPPIQTNIIESMDPEGPFGAKECGEGAIHPVIPAIANAIYDAVGIRVTSLPIRAEDVLQLIKLKNEQ